MCIRQAQPIWSPAERGREKDGWRTRMRQINELWETCAVLLGYGGVCVWEGGRNIEDAFSRSKTSQIGVCQV